MHNQLSHNNIQKSVFHTCTLNGMVLLQKHHNLLREYLSACDSETPASMCQWAESSQEKFHRKMLPAAAQRRIVSGNKSFADFDSAAIEGSIASSAEQIADATHVGSTIP
jgi:hypothetical protein